MHKRAPEIVGSSVQSRLRCLPPAAIAVARAVAMLGSGAQLRHVAALARLEPMAAAEATESAPGCLARAGRWRSPTR